jgi:hypothetical protein
VGLYFSSRCRHTSSALIAGLALLFGLWVLVPAIVGGAAIPGRTGPSTGLLVMHPFIQANVTISSVTMRDGSDRFSANSYEDEGFGPGRMTRILVISVLVYGIMSVFLLWRARWHLRRRVF